MNNISTTYSSNLVVIPPGSMLSTAISTSPILIEEGSAPAATGGDFDVGFDPNMDPELALALRVSLEEQRHRQEESARKEKSTTQEATAPPTQELGKCFC